MTIFTRPRWCIEPLRPQPQAVMLASLPLGAERSSLSETAPWACGSLRGRSRAGCGRRLGSALGPPGHVCAGDLAMTGYAITFLS